MFRTLLLAGAALAMLSGAASAKDLKAVGVTVGSLGNPYFVTVGQGITAGQFDELVAAIEAHALGE